MLKSIIIILSGNTANAALLLTRNLLIARMISVEDYGIAATFSVAVSIIEMTSTFGLQQLLIQDKRGNDPAFQAALQGFNVLRGFINAAILFALAGPFSQFLGIPEIVWAHRVLAVILIMNGLLHFDDHRLNRSMNYLPAALIATLSPLGALAAIWPLYLLFGDYRIMLWSMIVQSGANLIVSHLVAKRPYRLSFDRNVIAQCMRFGWPLLIDGILLFAIFNGEKLIIGRELGMSSLAMFTMAMTLTMTPALILQKTLSGFFLPQLSASDASTKFKELAAITIQSYFLCSGFLVLCIIMLGAPFVHLVLGSKYQDIAPLLALLALMQALRLMKAGGATISLSRARTSNGMFSNILRVATLPIAWYVAATGGEVATIVWVGIISEGFGLLISLLLVRNQFETPIRSIASPLALVLLILIVVGVGESGFLPHASSIAIVTILMLTTYFVMSDLRTYLRHRSVYHHGD